MSNYRPLVVTIAGHDPSGGAGLSADLKVFDAWGVQGQSVCTALTVQNESEFYAPGWIAWPQIESQLNALHLKHKAEYYKIGIVENAATLLAIVTWIRTKNPSAYILWDPILKASAGFDFHSQEQRSLFRTIAQQVSLLTPNQDEYEWLGGDLPGLVLLKGGHDQGDLCTDQLWLDAAPIGSYTLPRIPGANKHGSGCVLAASIVALMAKGLKIERACQVSRNFLQEYLQSAPGLLGSVQDALTPDIQTSSTEDESVLHSRLYVITWDGASQSHVEQVRCLCENKVRIIQLRMKYTDSSERLETAWQCLRICRQWGAMLVINDDVELARTIGAKAVHLGLTDMGVAEARLRLGPDVLIGGTANTPEHVRKRIAEGVDYIGLGPWRFTDTKQNLSAVLGLLGVASAMEVVQNIKPNLPVFVIGGITPQDCKEILECGATGVAVSSFIVSDQHPQMRVRDFCDAMAGIGSRL